MKVVIRVDSSFDIGSGHVMRCLTLAEALKARGDKVIFISRLLCGNMVELIKQKGFEVITLPLCVDKCEQIKHKDSIYEQWLGEGHDIEVNQVKTKLQKIENIDVLIVDHYSLDIRWQNQIKHYVNKLVVIDDLANRKHNCEILIDHNYYKNSKNRYNGLVSQGCKVLCGAEYALLSPGVISARRRRASNYQLPQREAFSCLVFMGGVDAGRYSGRITDILAGLSSILSIILVVGMNNKESKYLIKKFDASEKVVVEVSPKNYYELLARIDFVVGAGGVSVLERLCIGVPSFVYKIADNQGDICASIDDSDAGVYLGDLRTESDLGKSINKINLSLNSKVLDKMSKYGKIYVDEYGVERVIKKIYES
ncbi:MAG: UDP-2,4-diacetamido-2,4,6-trideoxy-beta-L-altropyranose hydrolase [Gammaproteobacteria bacterium]|nr:UDP-2,4-diacetamido-2,4,6-trideoxy-beta-L-altropyranose hydrolase [Gammaproteobacteria bacterium]